MTYSLCLSYINARHFHTPIDIWGNFVPGMIFFQSIFGYLVFAIIFKWSTDWLGQGINPPSLLNMLIYMFLQPGDITDDTRLYSGQGPIQVILVLLALSQVPVMLFLKPLYLRWEHNKARAQGYQGIGETTTISALDDDDEPQSAGADGQLNGRPSFADSEMDGAAMITQDIGSSEHEEFEFSEVMIHQVIHTIGESRLYTTIHVIASANKMNRVLPKLRLAHSILPSPLGALSRSSTALHRALGHDSQQRARHGRCARHLRHLRRLRPLVHPYRVRAGHYGGHECDVAFPALALGRGDE